MFTLYDPLSKPWLEDDDEWLVRLREDPDAQDVDDPLLNQMVGRRILDEDIEPLQSADAEELIVDSLESNGVDDLSILSDEIARELAKFPSDKAVKRVFWELLEFEPAEDPPPRDLVIPGNVAEVEILAALENSVVLSAMTCGEEGLDRDVNDLRELLQSASRIFGTTILVARHHQQLSTAILAICSASKVWIQPLAREAARVEAARRLLGLNPILGNGTSSLINIEALVSRGSDSELRRWLRANRPISEHWLELQITSSKVLSHDKQSELFLKLAELWPSENRDESDFPSDSESREIFDVLLVGNARLAAYIARHYFSRIARGLEFEDIYQAGLDGLCTAIRKFEPKRGNRFSTYGHWWIRQTIVREIGNIERTIRLPIHLVDGIQKLARRRRHLESAVGQVSDLELARSCGLTTKQVENLIGLEAPVLLELKDPLPAASLCVVDQIASDSLSSPVEESAERAEDSRDVSNLLQHLSPREERILRCRFGVGLLTDFTLEEVGKQYALTRERIRQIEARALDKLRQISGVPVKRKKKVHVKKKGSAMAAIARPSELSVSIDR